ncbi:sensor histidine kinase [Serpentinicella alkaliphila]|uniref:Sensor kinase SpoOB-type protein n=1 Tax=Serpentinicella alkaliphila TaxID=1734049 RepID=A0A4R2TQW6_9FIRM|nr:sensor histidine kinase [Serpentinicella alkaliphila]QUH24715.1 GHKL domain-containing protein [Serpentinicella alkaliphila]TCQ03705.1 sensor kinase SpoOB-type protein [Serpentinicella alkaliphila]
MPNSIFFSLLISIIDVALIFYFLVIIFNVRINKLLSAVYIVLLQAVFNTAVNVFLGYANFLGFVIMYVTAGIIFYLYFKKNILKLYFFIIVGLMLNFVMEIISIGLIVAIFRISPSILTESNVYRIIGIVISKSLFLIVVKYLISKLDILRHVEKKQFYLFLSLLFFNILIIFVAFSVLVKTGSFSFTSFIKFTGVIIGVIVFSALVFWSIRKILIQSQKEMLWEMKEKEYKNQLVYTKSIEEMFDTMKAQKHDFNNYISTIYGLIYLDKIAEAKEYLKSLAERVSWNSRIIDINHPIIAALINVKMERALRDNIDMEIDVNIPKELPYDLIDLTVVLGNLLDNAIEACLKKEENERYIFANIYIKETNFIIKIVNSKLADVFVCNENKERYTTKEDSTNHGYGLFNIKQVVKKYEGSIKIQDLENEFSVKIALPIQYNYEYTPIKAN